MEVLTTLVFDKPAWMWLGFLAVVLSLLAFDLGVLNRKAHVIGVRESLLVSALYISLGLAFGGLIWAQLGQTAALEYLTGFVVEKSLAIDNVFVIALIFSFFAIPAAFQHRVLFWGVMGVIVLRGLMIGFGAALVSQFSWILDVFAAFLILTGARMLTHREKSIDLQGNPALKLLRRVLPTTERLDGDRFFVKSRTPATGKATWLATPLFVAMVMIELADLVFAVDSVPAIFAITTDTYLVYTSNIFAILGLRALYFALAAMLFRFVYLKPALAVLLVFIGSKVFVADLMGWEKFPAHISLGGTFAILAVGVAASLWRTRRDQAAQPSPEPPPTGPPAPGSPRR